MRTILDGDLRRWEVYATTGDFGAPDPARIGFRCTSDVGQRPRVFVFEGDKSEAERSVAASPDGELMRMLKEAETVG
jgi:hypothetical protein